MPKEEWGTKRLCPTTGKRFFDLKKTPIVSPYTGETVILDNNNKGRAAVAEKAEKKPEKELVDETDEGLVDDEDDADVDLADDLLDDDEDDTVPLDDIADVSASDDD